MQTTPPPPYATLTPDCVLNALDSVGLRGDCGLAPLEGVFLVVQPVAAKLRQLLVRIARTEKVLAPARDCAHERELISSIPVAAGIEKRA